MLSIPVAALSKGWAWFAFLLGLRVWIPQDSWMAVSCDCCVLSGRGLCFGLITRPQESYRAWCNCVRSWSLENEDDQLGFEPSRIRRRSGRIWRRKRKKEKKKKTKKKKKKKEEKKKKERKKEQKILNLRRKNPLHTFTNLFHFILSFVLGLTSEQFLSRSSTKFLCSSLLPPIQTSWI